MILSEIHISAVKMYCYFSRNKSINESGSYWIASAISYASIAVVFVLILCEAHWIWFVFVATLNILSNNKTRKVSLGNITGQWAEMRNENEVERKVQNAIEVGEELGKKKLVDHINEALEELPQHEFTPEFQKKIIKKLSSEV